MEIKHKKRRNNIITGKFCMVCNEWYKPNSKYQKKCNACKIRIRPKKQKVKQSPALIALYEKYGLQ
jgi:hypothetical protein